MFLPNINILKFLRISLIHSTKVQAADQLRYPQILCPRFNLTFRILLLAAIVVTGILRVFKNLPDVVFFPGVTMFIDLAHMGFMMIYLFDGPLFVIIRSS